MDIELFGQFGQRLLTLDSRQSHLRLEGRPVVPAWSLRHALSCSRQPMPRSGRISTYPGCSDFPSQLWIDADESELRALMASAHEPVHPFPVLSMGLSADEQFRVARSYAASFAATPIEHRREDHAGARKLRIGYLSADFCRHATALLMAELFEHHDKSCFEIVAYSHGPEDRSELSLRLRGAFDKFIDLRKMTDDEAAKRIKADRIDILVELKGYTKGARTGISAQRPAPVLSFIGFPGTMGAG